MGAPLSSNPASAGIAASASLKTSKGRNEMITSLMTLSLAAGLVAVQAGAGDRQLAVNANAVTIGSGAQTSAAPAEAQPAAKAKTYCLKGTITGSRMSRQQCKTKKDWAKDGVDIDELLRQ